MSAQAVSTQTGWLLLGGFAVVWLLLGWLWGRKNAGFDDRVLAGRNVGLALGTATAMATWVTTNTTMAAPQLAYQLGVWGMFGYSLAAFGLVLFAPLARRIRHLMPTGYTSGDFVRARYGRAAWLAFLLISLFYALGWLVSMGMAGGILLEALAGIPYRVGMLTITSVCVGYTLLGGMRAVIGTDFMQSLLILVGLVVLGIAALDAAPAEATHAHLLAERPQLLDVLMPASILFLGNQLLFGIGEIFHSNVWWSRALAFREGVGFRAFLLGGLAWLPVPIVAGGIALVAPVLGVNVPRLDMVGPLVVGELLGGVGAILILAIVLSSLASSLDSLLAATSDLLVEDVYRQLVAPEASDRQLARATQVVVVALGGLAIVLCWNRLATLAEVLNLTGAFVAATIWPIAAGLYWRRASRHAATTALILGSALGLASYFHNGFYTAALVSAAVSMLCVVGGTLLAPERFDFAELRRIRRPSEDA